MTRLTSTYVLFRGQHGNNVLLRQHCHYETIKSSLLCEGRLRGKGAQREGGYSPNVHGGPNNGFVSVHACLSKSQIKLYQIIIAKGYAGSDKKVFFIDPVTGGPDTGLCRCSSLPVYLFLSFLVPRLLTGLTKDL